MEGRIAQDDTVRDAAVEAVAAVGTIVRPVELGHVRPEPVGLDPPRSSFPIRGRSPSGDQEQANPGRGRRHADDAARSRRRLGGR